jgi:hypothetical protein
MYVCLCNRSFGSDIVGRSSHWHLNQKWPFGFNGMTQPDQAIEYQLVAPHNKGLLR